MSYLIIGSSSGLGRELAYTFGKYNNDLILVSRDKRDLEAIKSDLGQKFETNVKILELDFSSLESIKKSYFQKKKYYQTLKV